MFFITLMTATSPRSNSVTSFLKICCMTFRSRTLTASMKCTLKSKFVILHLLGSKSVTYLCWSGTLLASHCWSRLWYIYFTSLAALLRICFSFSSLAACIYLLLIALVSRFLLTEVEAAAFAFRRPWDLLSTAAFLPGFDIFEVGYCLWELVRMGPWCFMTPW